MQIFISIIIIPSIFLGIIHFVNKWTDDAIEKAKYEPVCYYENRIGSIYSNGKSADVYKKIFIECEREVDLYKYGNE